MSALNREFAAEVLIDPMFTTDAQAGQKYGISIKTPQGIGGVASNKSASVIKHDSGGVR